MSARLTKEEESISAQSQMAFQERMSNTAHQREVEDLKAAGLNPVLSSGGSGASTPNGAAGDISGEQITKLLGSSIDTTAKAISGLTSSLQTVSNAWSNFGQAQAAADDASEQSGDAPIDLSQFIGTNYSKSSQAEIDKALSKLDKKMASDMKQSINEFNNVVTPILTLLGLFTGGTTTAAGNALKVGITSKTALGQAAKSSDFLGFATRMKEMENMPSTGKWTPEERLMYALTGKIPKHFNSARQYYASGNDKDNSAEYWYYRHGLQR